MLLLLASFYFGSFLFACMVKKNWDDRCTRINLSFKSIAGCWRRWLVSQLSVYCLYLFEWALYLMEYSITCVWSHSHTRIFCALWFRSSIFISAHLWMGPIPDKKRRRMNTRQKKHRQSEKKKTKNKIVRNRFKLCISITHCVCCVRCGLSIRYNWSCECLGRRSTCTSILLQNIKLLQQQRIVFHSEYSRYRLSSSLIFCSRLFLVGTGFSSFVVFRILMLHDFWSIFNI